MKLVSNCNWNSSLLLGGGVCVKLFALTERGGIQCCTLILINSFQVVFKLLLISFHLSFLSLKIRILHVLFMFFCFIHILENLTIFEKFANSLGVPNLITKQRFHSLITGVYLQRLRTRCPTNSGFVNEHNCKWCYLRINHLQLQLNFRMLITRSFFFRVVKVLASSRHNSMFITDGSSHCVSYSYMYTTCDGCVIAAEHNVTTTNFAQANSHLPRTVNAF